MLSLLPQRLLFAPGDRLTHLPQEVRQPATGRELRYGELPEVRACPFFRRPRIGFAVVGEDREGFTCFSIAPDGKLLAARSAGFHEKDRPVHVWEVATGRPLKDLTPPRLLGRQPSNCNALAFTPDSRSPLVFSRARLDKEDTLAVWDVSSGERRALLTVPLAIE